MCKTCANKDNCTINPNVCTVKKCKKEAAIIQRALQLAWSSNYGLGKGTDKDCVAGYYCYDWEHVFTKSLTNQKLSCFKFETAGATAPDRIDEKTGEPVTPLHAYTRIRVGNGTTGCSTLVDDGFLDGKLVHDPPFPEIRDSPYVDQPDPNDRKHRKPSGTVIPKL